MASINLLPQDVVRVHKAQRLTTALKSASMVLGALSLGLGFILGGYYFYKQKNLHDLQDQYSSYKSQVLALESTENSLVLVKDRLSKIAEDNTKYPYNQTLSVTDRILNGLPEGTTLHQIDGSAEHQTITLGIKDSATLTDVLSKFTDDEQVGTLTIENINYNSSTGYEVVLNIKNP